MVNTEVALGRASWAEELQNKFRGWKTVVYLVLRQTFNLKGLSFALFPSLLWAIVQKATLTKYARKTEVNQRAGDDPDQDYKLDRPVRVLHS